MISLKNRDEVKSCSSYRSPPMSIAEPPAGCSRVAIPPCPPREVQREITFVFTAEDPHSCYYDTGILQIAAPRVKWTEHERGQIGYDVSQYEMTALVSAAY
jgi:hypothetical protein